MLRFNLVNFETVRYIATLGSFGAAALRLHTSQPAITSRVRELEESVGFAFFQKRGRRMELTIQGREFIQRVDPLVRQIEQEVQGHAGTASLQGVVRIGIAHVMLRWFPEVIAQLRRDMPGVHYEIDVDAGASMLQKLETGRMDIGVVAGKPSNARLESVSMYPVELQWLMSSKLPRERDGRVLELGELLDSAPIWLIPRSSILFPEAVSALRRSKAGLRNINACVHMAAILEMIVHDTGIGLTATSVAQDLLRAGVVQPVSSELAPMALDVTLMCHRDQHQSIVRHVMQRIVEFDRRVHGTGMGNPPLRPSVARKASAQRAVAKPRTK